MGSISLVMTRSPLKEGGEMIKDQIYDQDGNYEMRCVKIISCHYNINGIIFLFRYSFILFYLTYAIILDHPVRMQRVCTYGSISDPQLPIGSLGPPVSGFSSGVYLSRKYNFLIFLIT